MAFERIILANLLHREEYTRSILPHLHKEYFSNESERLVFEKIQEFVNNYNVPPTKEALAINISNSNLNENTFDEVISIVKGLEKDDNDYKWLVTETEQHCKRQALFNAMYKAIDIAEGNVKDTDPNIIPGMLMEALSVGFSSDIGHDYFDEADDYYDRRHSPESRHPFSIEILNRVTKGGIKDKTLNVVLAPINGGKTIHLIQQAADWLVRGKNVLYISMEMDEDSIRERIDTVAMDMTFDQVFALEKRQYLNRINQLKAKTQGRLKIKEYPAGTAHIGHFRHYLRELKIKDNFVPDLICLDYLTITASSKLPHSAKGNTNTYFTSVAEEVRSFAQEIGIPFWTAVQFDRATQGANDAGMGNIGLALGIAATADFMFAVLTPEELAARGQVIGKIIKNRYSSYKGKFMLGLNPEKQQYYEIDQAQGMSEDELNELGISNVIPKDDTTIIHRKAASKATEGWDFN